LVSKSERAELRTRLAVCDLSRIVQRVASESAEVARGSSIHVRTEAEPELPFLGDEELIGQALENLMSNAIRHAPSGSSVTMH
jgi:two-component system sensor histidine kinase ResE